jgi:hypothetical protein
MPFLTSNSYDPSGDVVIDVLADGIAWDLSATTVISWGLADGLNPNDVWGNRAAAIDDFSRALAVIQPYINVQFSYLGEFDNPIAAGEAGADLVYTLDNAFSEEGTLAYAYFPGPGVFSPEKYASEGGDVFMNYSDDIIATSSFNYGSDGFVTIVHEIGHALGLKHPFVETPGRPSIATMGRDDIIDVDWMTVMSYTDPFENELERLDPATLMVLDVLALQYIYGANAETNTGNTIHTIESQDYFYSIWDASGIDVIDVSAMSEGWTVNLPSVVLSTANPTPIGLAVKSSDYRETLTEMVPTELVWLLGDIEDVIGTAHDDTLNGNSIANVLFGGAGNDLLFGSGGNDSIDGGEGEDRNLLGAAQRQYTLTLRPDGMTIEDRRADGDGVDQLTNIELLLFDGNTGGDAFDLRKFAGPAGLSGAELESFIELYIAYFNRAPDAVGLSFWGTAFATGTTLEDMAALFGPQAETIAAYPLGTANEVFATTVYNNVLGRTPDQAGIDFWVDQLDSGNVSRDQFILQVLQGAKSDPKPELGQDFVDQQLADQAYLVNKIDIGAYFAVHKGMSEVANAVSAMALFDGTQTGIDAAVAAIDAFYAEALDAENGTFLMPLVGVLDNPFEAVA